MASLLEIILHFNNLLKVKVLAVNYPTKTVAR